MAPPGGPAAIYGFLFQVLRTAELALKIDLSAPNRNLSDVTMIAEPRGGDVRVQSPREVLVRQFKTRGEGTWGLAEILEKVIPDLYQAVSEPQMSARYELATNGAMGEWGLVLDFFHGLATRDFESLDRSQPKFRLRDESYTEGGLFDEIVDILRRRASVRDEDEEETRRGLWDLLARFDFVPMGDADDAERSVRRLLSSYLIDDGQLDDKVARLVKTVLGYATTGNRSFTPEELLAESGIDGVSFTKLPLVREALRQLTLADMRRLVRYDQALSVRSPVPWSPSDPILVLSGESGQGKSWALADLAHALLAGDRRAFVVFTRATGDLERDLTRAAQRIVRDALGHNTTASFEQLSAKIRKEISDIGDPWLTVCLDDVRTSAEVSAICEAPLEEWGIRIALTALPPQASHASVGRRGARVEAVRDFTDTELRRFLGCRRREWGAIPADVRRTMRRPLLADIYVRLGAEWRPKSEYELYKAVWKRLVFEREQPDHPGDVSIMLALATNFRDGGEYPWSASTLRRLGVTDDEQVRLEEVGWFTREASGAVRIWHDRLLNWAVAEAIAEEIQELQGKGASLSAILIAYLGDLPTDPERPQLIYVPMDVLWIVASRNVLTPSAIAQAIHELESTAKPGDIRSLYTMLASLGPAIVPSLVERIHASEGQEEQYPIEGVVRDAIRSALRDSGTDGEPLVALLLNDSSETLHNLGIALAADNPAAAHVDRLWTMFLDHEREEANESDPQSRHSADLYFKRERLTSAISACVALRPEWLQKRAEALEANDRHAATLAWFLASIRGSEGGRLWLAIKDTLFDKTPRSEPRGLIECIERFRDGSEIPRLEAWLTSETDFAGPSALGALAIVAPDRAVAFVRSDDYRRTSGFSSWWFPWLALIQKAEALKLAKEQLKVDDDVPEWFSGREEILDVDTTHAFVALFSKQLRDYLATPPPEEGVLFRSTARLLASASSVETLDVLASFKGSGFEELLRQTAERLLPQSNGEWIPDAGVDIRTILRRVSADGAQHVVISDMQRDGQALVQAIAWAAADSGDEVRNALRSFVSRCAEGWDGQEVPRRVACALHALISIGDDEAAIDVIRKFGADAANDLPAWLWGDRQPMNEVLVTSATERLSSNSMEERCGALAALRLSRRRDVLSLVLRHAHSPEPTERWHALRAACDLIDQGTEIAPLVRDLVAAELGDDRHLLATLLHRSGTTSSMNLLEQLARKLPFKHVSDHTVTKWLVDETPRGKAMAQLLEKHLPPFPHTGLFTQEQFTWVRVLPALDREDLRQKALDAAGTPIPMVNPLSVIECVATFDRDAAFEFAWVALRGEIGGREFLPPYLLRYNPSRTVDALVRHLPDEQSGPVRWSVCRTLRWSEDPSLKERIEEMWCSPSADVRGAACDIAGWVTTCLDDKRLRDVALRDDDHHVRVAARDALNRRLRLRQSAALRGRLVFSEGPDTWLLAEALAHYVDPFLLERPSDPLSIGVALQNKPRALSEMVEAWLEARRKDVHRDSESEDLVRGRRRR